MAVLNVNIPEFYECFTGGIWEIVISPSYPMSHSGKFKCISNLTLTTHVPFKLWEGGGAEMVKMQMDFMNRVDEKTIFSRETKTRHHIQMHKIFTISSGLYVTLVPNTAEVGK